MTSATTENEGFRHRLRRGLSRFRSQSRHTLNDTSVHLPQNTQAVPSLATDLASISQHATSTTSSLSPNQASDVHRDSIKNRNNEAHIKNSQGSLRWNSVRRNLTIDQLTFGDDIGSVTASTDLWSAAYREAVESLGEEIDIATLHGKNVSQLFREPARIDEELTDDSAFLKSLGYLRSIQIPLERFKLALDLASPLTNLEPTTTTVCGVVRNVTVIAISFASADLDFAKQIAEMLEQISYIDDCDTLGQKTDRKDIHKALVLVYQKILEFYKVAFEILTRKGAKLIVKMVLDNYRLPSIIQDFLRYSDTLRSVVQKATWEIVEDIKAMLYDHEIARWLGSDKMSRQAQHHAYLQDLRADRACEFLLNNTDFVNWYRAPNSRQLAILGDMGSGKTVAMTFLVDELSRRNEYQLPQPKICYYYCRGDETGKAIYIFSALILSLLEQLPGLKKPFFEWYKQALVSGFFDPATNTKKLEEFLQKLLDAIDRPVFIIIDGLDDCNRASRNCLLKLLKTLSQRVMGLKTILSFRPQEEILGQLDGVARIHLGSDAQRDGIIVEKTVERQLFYLSTDVKAFVTERLSRLAQGSAIWSKMVVELIEVRGIRAINPMRSFFEEIPLPRQLSKLYATIFSRCTAKDPENQEIASTALGLLAITHRPLSILELAWAVTFGATQHVTSVDALAKLVDPQRIMSLIHPFIACVDFSNLRKCQVQLTHQSVKEFITREWTPNKPDRQGSALTETDNMLLDRRVESLEAFILDICIRYLLLDDIGNRDLFSEEQMAIAELPQEVDLFNDDEESVEYDPYCTWESWEEKMIRFDPTNRGFGEFFVYASCHWLEHFGATAVEHLPGLASIEKLCQADSTRLRNWTLQNCRPGCAIMPRFQFDSSLYDPLSITSLYGSEATLRHMLGNSDFEKDTFLREPAMKAADQILDWGDVPRLKILFLDEKLGHQLQNLNFFRLLIKKWPNHRGNFELAFDLVDYVSDILVHAQWGNELLCVAASEGCMPIIRRLITSAQHKPALKNELLREFQCEAQWSRSGEPMHQSIGEAVLGNHVDVVRYLLEENDIEAHLRYRNSCGENVLHLASRLCNPDMFQLLVPRFQEGIHQADNQGDTALERIIMSSSTSLDRYESAKILLVQSGTDWNSHFSDGQQDPLWAAVQLGDLDMCRLFHS